MARVNLVERAVTRSLAWGLIVFVWGATGSIAVAENIVVNESLIGVERVQAIVKLEELGLTYDIRRVPECGIPDTVIGTIPKLNVGTVVPPNEIITLKVTTKTGLATVPENIIGMSLADATILLEQDCFDVKSRVVKSKKYQSDCGECCEVITFFEPNNRVVDKITKVTPSERSRVYWTSQVTLERRTGFSRKSRSTGRICP